MWEVGKWSPKVFYILITGTCENVRLHSKRDTDVYNSLLDSVEEGEGGMIWENGIETCIITYVKRIASSGSMHDIGCSGLVQWDDPEGW